MWDLRPLIVGILLAIFLLCVALEHMFEGDYISLLGVSCFVGIIIVLSCRPVVAWIHYLKRKLF